MGISGRMQEMLDWRSGEKELSRFARERAQLMRWSSRNGHPEVWDSMETGAAYPMIRLVPEICVR
jgi:hypothetical protein